MWLRRADALYLLADDQPLCEVDETLALLDDALAAGLNHVALWHWWPLAHGTAYVVAGN